MWGHEPINHLLTTYCSLNPSASHSVNLNALNARVTMVDPSQRNTPREDTAMAPPRVALEETTWRWISDEDLGH
jgi:hypothetical protein